MKSLAGKLNNWFQYHALSAVDQVKCMAIRNAAFAFAEAIVSNTPLCEDQAAAIRKVREAVMTANAAIACKGT